MSEDPKPTEERPTGEMTAVDKPSEADAPKMPEAKASPDAKAEAKPAEAKPADAKPEATSESKAESNAAAKPVDAKSEPKVDAKSAAAPTSNAETPEAPKADAKPEPKADAKPEPKADAKPEPKADAAPAKPEAESAARTTATMTAAVGTPPAAPGDVESPTLMPSKDDLPSGSPTDPAKAPGAVPSGDSRSLRRATEFALIYRQGSAVITRFGTVGQRGQWRVVEYPTPSSASNAYAKECSRFVGEGFSDYRD